MSEEDTYDTERSIDWEHDIEQRSAELGGFIELYEAALHLESLSSKEKLRLEGVPGSKLQFCVELLEGVLERVRERAAEK